MSSGRDGCLLGGSEHGGHHAVRLEHAKGDLGTAQAELARIRQQAAIPGTPRRRRPGQGGDGQE